MLLSLSSLNGHFSKFFFSLYNFIIAENIYLLERTMKDKSLNNLVFLLLVVVVFTWRKQENAFALQGKNNYVV